MSYKILVCFFLGGNIFFINEYESQVNTITGFVWNHCDLQPFTMTKNLPSFSNKPLTSKISNVLDCDPNNINDFVLEDEMVLIWYKKQGVPRIYSYTFSSEGDYWFIYNEDSLAFSYQVLKRTENSIIMKSVFGSGILDSCRYSFSEN